MSQDAECIDKSGKVIPGLYVAGEAAGQRLDGGTIIIHELKNRTNMHIMR